MSDAEIRNVPAPEPVPEVADVPVQTAMGAAPGEVQFRAGEGRRVRLVRNRDGQYSIYMGSTHIQSFCNEWENITRYPLPYGIEQQVQINIHPLGEAREAREYTEERLEAQRPVAPGGPEDLNRLEARIAERAATYGEATVQTTAAGERELVNIRHPDPMDRVVEQIQRELQTLHNMLDMIQRLR